MSNKLFNEKDKLKSWPFVEAKRIIESLFKNNTKNPSVVLQTGYGPSGLPHIGTFGEVVRTSMVKNALDNLIDCESKIITFSDDMDGLRKVPENVPNKKMLENYINFPLTSIPDPFGKYQSFGEHNNEKLKSFLNQFGFSYQFMSSTDLYKSGKFDETIKLILKNHKKILSIVLPTLRDERRKTYSPFLPICPKTNKVLQVKVEEYKIDSNTIVYKDPENNKFQEVSVLQGNSKLQWKVDWAMRWYALDVDFEMYGKDLKESEILSTKIINLLGKNTPSGFAYELFLDEKGEKISKSKGNGITINQWLEFASPESLSLFMYQNPKRAKKLYKEIVPKAVDEYLDFLEKSKNQDDKQLILNPVWHVHNGKVPTEEMIMTFSMLLNLVETSNANTKDLLWKFVKKNKPNIKEENFPIFDKLIEYSIKFFNEVIKENKKYKKPNSAEKKALEELIKVISECDKNMLPEDIQTKIYSVGKENGYKDNLRDWFKLIYEVVFGDENGPRLGFFISFFGIEETKELIKEKIKNV